MFMFALRGEPFTREVLMRAARGFLGLVSSVVLVGALAIGASPPGAGAAGTDGSGAVVTTRAVPGGQKTRLERGTAGGGEVAPAIGDEAATPKAAVANRSLSSRAKADRAGPGLSG